MKKFFRLILLSCLLLFLFAGCNNNVKEEVIVEGDEPKLISINVFDKNSERIYYTSFKTNAKYLLDVLKEDEDLEFEYEDGEYGAYITKMFDVEQGDNYYWTYYINDEYALTGVSSCLVEDKCKYDFKISSF